MSNTIKLHDNIRIKQIGKGSFSNVFLCKRNNINVLSSSSFTLTELFSQSSDKKDENFFFIIKEINLNALVKRYASKKHKRTFDNTTKDKDYTASFENMSITPYKKDNNNTLFRHKNLEYDYYYDRLRSLIESEIDILKLLEHDNIIGFYDYHVTDNIYSLYTEYCNKGDMYQILKSGVAPKGNRNTMGGITGQFLFEFIYQISTGLNYLEKQNIIHRDIKLHNILLHSINDSLEFKISDFGFACYNLKRNPELYDSVLGRKYFKLCGSPYYMAPELIRNLSLLENFTQYKNGNHTKIKSFSIDNLPLFYDTKYDVFSFGICLYELIFNHLPLPKIKNISDLEKFYKGNSSQQAIDQRIFKNKHIDIILQELIAKLLRVDHVFRPTTNEIVEFFSINIKSLTAACINSDNKDDIQTQNNESCISQAELKDHVVNQPIEAVRGDGEHSSWHYINNSNSLIRNIDAERGFLDWLMKHTKQ